MTDLLRPRLAQSVRQGSDNAKVCDKARLQRIESRHYQQIIAIYPRPAHDKNGYFVEIMVNKKYFKFYIISSLTSFLTACE